jgi:hypothetical protein
MMTCSRARRFNLSALSLVVLPMAALVFVACDDSEDAAPGGSGNGSGANGGRGGASGGGTASAGDAASPNAGSPSDSEGGAGGGAAGSPPGSEGGAAGAEAFDYGGEGFGGAAAYDGPSVGKAWSFAALAYGSITTANISTIRGELGLSAAAVSNITGFDAASYLKYGIDSLAPDSQRTIQAQQDVTALVGDIDPRPCDVDLTDVVGGLTGDITLHPGVTCMNSFSAEVLLNGHVYLDAGGDPNAFFIIRGNMTLKAADAAQVVLQNGAQACGVFWRISKAVTIGKTVKFVGTVIAGTAITMKSGSTLNGRALAQTAGVQLDANSVKTPAACTHVQ